MPSIRSGDGLRGGKGVGGGDGEGVRGIICSCFRDSVFGC